MIDNPYCVIPIDFVDQIFKIVNISYELDIFTEFYITELQRFQQNICNGCGMPTGDADSSRHLVLSHFGTCKCSNVETNISWTCLVSGLLSFEHPSVLLFLLYMYNAFWTYVRFWLIFNEIFTAITALYLKMLSFGNDGIWSFYLQYMYVWICQQSRYY